MSYHIIHHIGGSTVASDREFWVIANAEKYAEGLRLKDYKIVTNETWYLWREGRPFAELKDVRNHELDVNDLNEDDIKIMEISKDEARRLLKDEREGQSRRRVVYALRKIIMGK